jgi:hypothetical protein
MSKFTTYQLGEIYKSVSTTTAGTPVNSNGINLLNSLLIPANTFAAGDIITIQGMVSKDNAGSTYVPYFYWNTSASLVGAILIATGVAGATTGRNIMLYRRLHILTANGTGIKFLKILFFLSFFLLYLIYGKRKKIFIVSY